MAENTKIEWCDHTFNPWIGCAKVSPGCQHCYAEQLMDKRLGKVNWGPGNPRQRTSESNWKQVERWNLDAEMEEERYVEAIDDPSAVVAGMPYHPKVFVASLADWLDPEVPIDWLADLLTLISRCPHLDFLMLTKRPEQWKQRIYDAGAYANQNGKRETAAWLYYWHAENNPPHNVWIGTSVENQDWADKRIPALLQIPARIRFLSCEPLLGPVDLGLKFASVPAAKWYPSGEETPAGPYPWTSRWVRLPLAVTSDYFCFPPVTADAGIYRAHSNKHGALTVETKNGRLGIKPDEFECLPGVDWVICGGESGPSARPMHPDWARSLRDQCQAANVPFFFKQWGSWAPLRWNATDENPGKCGSHRADGSDEPKPRMFDLGDYGNYQPRNKRENICGLFGKAKAGRLLDGRSYSEFPTTT
jgi:protein gp37